MDCYLSAVLYLQMWMKLENEHSNVYNDNK